MQQKSIWTIIVSAIITAIIVGGGTYLWQRSVTEKAIQEAREGLQQQITDIQDQIKQLQKTEKVTEQKVQVPVDWKTYRSEEHGFEVKYPNTWKVSESDSRINFMVIGGQDVSLSFFVYNKPIDEAQSLLPLFSVPGRKINSRTNITINNIDWVKLVVEENQIAQLTYKDGKTYAAQHSTFENVGSQVLSTFKFTK